MRPLINEEQRPEKREDYFFERIKIRGSIRRLWNPDLFGRGIRVKKNYNVFSVCSKCNLISQIIFEGNLK